MRLVLNFFDGVTSATQPTFGNIDTSNLVSYVDDAAYEAANAGAPSEGNMYANTTLNVVRYYNGSAWVTVADNLNTVTFQNKTVIDNAIGGSGNDVQTTAAKITYDNGSSGLSATDSQAAIDEVEARVDTAETNISSNDTDIADLYSTKQDVSEKGQANGYASLDANSRVPVAQMPISAMTFNGNWNANTNTPTLADTDTNEDGTTYRVNVAGTTDFGAGNITFEVGDWVYNDGSNWLKGDNIDQVTSVNSKTGAVVLDADDISDTSTTHKFADGSIDTHSDVDTSTVSPTDGQALVWNDGDSEWQPGNVAASGGTGKNYMVGGDFENGSDFVTTYDDTGTYVDGTGGSPSVITQAENTTTPLSGTTDLKVSKSASDGSGEGVTLTTPNIIDRSVRGKYLYFRAQWDGTHAQYVDGDLALKVYSTGTDDTELFFHPISGFNDDGSLPARQTELLGYVVTNLDSDSYLRASLHLETDNNTGNAWDCYLDDVTFGPSGVVPGFIGHEWKSFTPTWSNLTLGNGSTSGFYRRNGDSMEIAADLKFGSTTSLSGNLALVLPNGYKIAGDKYPSASGQAPERPVGVVGALDNGTAFLTGNVFISGTDNVRFMSDGLGSAWATTVPFTWTTNDEIGFKATVPIEGWEASGSFNITDLNLQIAKASTTVSGGTHSTTSTWETVGGTYVEISDDFNQLSSGTFTPARKGWYFFSGIITWATNSTGVRGARFNISSDSSYINGSFVSTASASGTINVVSGFVELDVTDTVVLQGYQTSGSSLGYQESAFQVVSFPDFHIVGLHGSPNKTQTKILSANITSDTTITDWTYSDLKIGMYYELKGQVRALLDQNSMNDDAVSVVITHDSATVGFVEFQIGATDGLADQTTRAVSFLFKATNTTLTFTSQSASADSLIQGNGTRGGSFVQLTERNDLVETDEW